MPRMNSRHQGSPPAAAAQSSFLPGNDAQAPHESERILRALLDAIQESACLFDRNGIVLAANAVFAARLNRTLEECLGASVYSLIPAATAARRKPIVEEALRTGNPITFEDEREGRWIHHSLCPIRGVDGTFDRIVVYASDITERKRAEAKREEEQALTRATVDAIPCAFYMLDGDGCYVRWNAYQRDEIIGLPEDQIHGYPALDTIHPDDRELIKAKIENVMRSGQAELVEGRVLLHGGPESRWLLMTGKRLIFNEKPFLVGIGIDITDRKRTEAEKDRLQEQLLQAQKMESVGRLAGGVAHDFNNMLGVILGHTEMALAKTKPEEPTRGQFEAIKTAAERSADLTRQLLAFARKQTVTPKALDLNDAIAGTLKMLRRLIDEHIELIMMPGADLWLVKIDPSQVDQILANLCVNARDALANAKVGTGTITIAVSNLVLSPAECANSLDAMPGDYVRITVTDNGCGMDKGTMAHLFEPFFTTKEVGKGTGLGLSTVYGIVKQNRGFIQVHSHPGQGSTFHVHLPRHVGKIASVEEEKPMEPAQHGGETILLVEDEPALLELGRDILAHLGYTVLIATTPSEAIEQAELHPGRIDLLITDVVMPEMNGRELARKILPLYPDARRLFISGYTADIIAHQGILDEDVNFLQKPFSMHGLAAKVREALDGKPA